MIPVFAERWTGLRYSDGSWKRKVKMTDLSYRPESRPEKIEPEEIVIALTAIAMSISIVIAFLAAL